MQKNNCRKCRNELFLDPMDPTALTVESYPVYAKFTCWKLQGGLVLPSPAILKIVKATEVVFKRRVIDNKTSINTEKMLDLKIQTAVLKQLGIGIFRNVDGHFFDHEIGQEQDHLSSLMRKVIQRYVHLRLKMYGKMFTEFTVHKNLPSVRHELNKSVLFRHQ